MATPAQILANRANARHSTGPKTAEGKAASARNATRHGLSGTHFALMPNEDPAQFAELVQSLEAEFRPASDHERFLVDTMAKARWRILRIERLECEALEDLFTDPSAPGGTPDAQLLYALKPASSIFDKLARYAAAAQRAYHKAHREIQAARTPKTRVQNEPNQFLLNQLLEVQIEPNPAPRSCPEVRRQAVETGPLSDMIQENRISI